MRALVVVWGVVMGVSGAAAGPAAEDAAKASKAPRVCRVELDATAVRVNGAVVTDAAGVAAALGAPGRVERVEGRERYEEFGFDGQPPTSVMVPVAWVYRVYDAAGVVVEAREGRKGGPAWLHVLLAGDPPAHAQEAPRVRPTGRGCAVVIGGVALEPKRDALPAGVGASSAGFEAFGRRFGVTSFGGAVDSIHAHGGGPVVRVWFTAPGSGRPGWVRVALGG